MPEWRKLYFPCQISEVGNQLYYDTHFMFRTRHLKIPELSKSKRHFTIKEVDCDFDEYHYNFFHTDTKMSPPKEDMLEIKVPK